MPNIANKERVKTERAFIDEVARLLVPWGVPPAGARLYGYLLLRDEPVTLDCMAADLGMSKSTVSVAARLLEQYMLARRHGERGSKRVLYEASENYEGMITSQNRLIEALAGAMRKAAPGTSGKTRQRLKEMATFYDVTREAMESALRRWRR